MKPMLPVLLLLLFVPAYGQAPAAEDIRQGGRIWSGYFTNENDCKNCHGVNGEGGFASALAGHQLTDEQFLRTTREGAGMTMPGFTADKNLSDQEIFQIAAYLRSLPGYTGPPPNWRTPILPSYTTAQQTYIEAGCGQCHAAWAHNPRRDMGALGPDADFAWLQREVYSHTTSPDFADSNHLRMGNYRRDQVSEETLREIWHFMMEEQGPRVPIGGSISEVVFTDQGIRYSITVRNTGVPGNGLAAEHISVVLPVLRARDPEEETIVVEATAGGEFVGMQRDLLSNTNSAVFNIPRLGPGEMRELTITVSGVGAMVGFPRASIKWELPKMNTGGTDIIMISQPFGR